MIEKPIGLISMLYPPFIINRISRLIMQGGVHMPPRVYAGTSLIWSVALALAVFKVSTMLNLTSLIATGLAILVFIFLQAVFYVLLLMVADSRASKIEESLPEALQMISANVRAGMTVENAIWMGARPEFGPLEDEIRRVSSKVFGGKPITDALMEMGERVRSTTLNRAVKLLVEGIALGGEIAPLLDEVGRDIRSTKALKREIMNATMMYTIFIIFSSVFASPFLFASSLYYTEVSILLLSKRTTQAPPAGLPTGALGIASMAFSGGPVALLSPEDVRLFSISAILITTSLGAIALAEIRYGKISRGLRLVPIFVIAALLMFFFAHSLLQSMFSYLIK